MELFCGESSLRFLAVMLRVRVFNTAFLDKHKCMYTSEEKLVPNLLLKKDYVVHHKALKQMLSQVDWCSWVRLGV